MSKKTQQELLQKIKELEHENTMLKEAGTADKLAENYIHDILNNIAAPLFLKDSKGKYLYSNKRYGEVIHMLPADIIGKNDYDVVPQQIAELFRSQDQEVMAKKAPIEFEETIPLPDGIQSFITAKFPLFGKDGTISGVGGFCTDITERKKAEANLRLAKEEAEEATKLKDKFVSLVSHDLKNPIQRMMSCLNLIDSTQEISEQGREMIKEGYLACEDMGL